MNSTHKAIDRTSTDHIKIPSTRGPNLLQGITSCNNRSIPFYEELRELLWACGPEANSHQLVTIGIKACIVEGSNTRGQIIGLLVNQGFNRGHIATVLKHSTGNNPDTYEWSVDDNGRYSVLD